MVLDAITGWCRPLASPPARKFDRLGREAASRPSKLLLRVETDQTMDVDVIDHAVSSCGRDTYTVYVIAVTINGVTSTVLRRYRQFFALHEQLRRVVAPAASSPAFPDRIVLNNRSASLVRHRQTMLNLYLKALAADAIASTSHQLRTFLGLEVMENEASQYVGFEWTHRSGRFS